MSSSDLGYIFDFLASLWIIRSIIFRSQRHIEVESQQLWDGNPLLHEAQLRSFYDGWIGMSQFLIGLMLHLLHFEIKFYIGIFIIILSILLSILVGYFSNKNIEHKMRKIYPSSYDVVKKRAKSGD